MVTFRLWYLLMNPNEQATLYHRLRWKQFRYGRWASYDFGGLTLLLIVFGILLAPLFVMLPLLTIFVMGAYWAGYVAGELQYERSHARYDLLALLPNGAMAVCWTLATLRIRHSNLFPYVVDGLRITALLGGMLVFMLSSGLVIAFLGADRARYAELVQLVSALVSVGAFFSTLYVGQMQAIVLCQLLGIFTPTIAAQPMEARAWAVMLYVGVQMFTHVAALTAALRVLPFVLAALPLSGALSVLLAGAGLVTVQEGIITLLWRHLTVELGRLEVST